MFEKNIECSNKRRDCLAYFLLGSIPLCRKHAHQTPLHLTCASPFPKPDRICMSLSAAIYTWRQSLYDLTKKAGNDTVNGYSHKSLIGTLCFPSGPSFPRLFVLPT